MLMSSKWEIINFPMLWRASLMLNEFVFFLFRVVKRKVVAPLLISNCEK